MPYKVQSDRFRSHSHINWANYLPLTNLEQFLRRIKSPHYALNAP